MKVFFLHGWQSTPGGLKPTYLKDHGHEVLNPHLPDSDFDAAVRIAQAEYEQSQPDVVVGSSRGGAVAMNIDSGDTPLVLLCPAWKTWGTATTVKPNTTILHSRVDETVPFADSEELVRNSGLSSGALIDVGTEHRLADPKSLEAMLTACDRLSGCFEYFLVSQVAGTHVLRFKDLAGVIRDCEHTGVILNLDHELRTVVDREKWSSVILDFEGREFGPCHAFQQILMALHKTLGDGLKLCHLPPMVREHFEWNRLAERLNIYPTRKDAIEAMKP